MLTKQEIEELDHIDKAIEKINRRIKNGKPELSGQVPWEVRRASLVRQRDDLVTGRRKS